MKEIKPVNQINFDYNGKHYCLEYTREAVKRMEAAGFKPGESGLTPLLELDMLWAGAFYKNHRNVSSRIIEEILDKMKENSFYLNGTNPRKVYVFESPIDLLSHATLADIRSGNKGEWIHDSRLSLGGNSDVALEHYVKEYPKVEEICFCVDNDMGGEKAIKAYAGKYKDMGYIVTREIPKLKDFNEDLVDLIRPHPNIMKR